MTPIGTMIECFFARYSRTNFTVMRSMIGNGLFLDVEVLGMACDSFWKWLLFVTTQVPSVQCSVFRKIGELAG